jgi:uncharacterized protein (TIGR03086 family)
MSTNSERYLKSLADFDAVIRTVPADGWERQSPCEEWKAIDVVGHVVGGLGMITHAAKGETMPGGSRPTPRQLAGSDPIATWAAGRQQVEEALQLDGALDKTFDSPFGPMPLDTFVGILTTDVITHTWDLGQAMGEDVRLDPELVTACYEAVKPMDAMIRRPGVFHAKVEAPAGADEQAEFMAFLGRTPLVG